VVGEAVRGRRPDVEVEEWEERVRRGEEEAKGLESMHRRASRDAGRGLACAGRRKRNRKRRKGKGVVKKKGSSYSVPRAVGVCWPTSVGVWLGLEAGGCRLGQSPYKQGWGLREV
jgi:hypothetical protein